MSSITASPPQDHSPQDADQVDLREQPYNGREVGPIEQVQLPTQMITSLHGIVLDVDPPLLQHSELMPGAETGPKSFYRQTVRQWLARDPALANAEVRTTGRGLHVIIWLAEPQHFQTEAERHRWAGVVQVVQAALPIDPDQPGITALTRPIGSLNSKTCRRVKCLAPGTPVPVDEVLRLYDDMVRAPFRSVMAILLGANRVSPCPVCQAEGTLLSALDHVGRCYGSCGRVKLEQLYDLFLVPRVIQGRDAANAQH